MKILLFGKNGQVGWELQRSLSPLGEVIALDRRSTELCGDLADLSGITETVRRVAPDVIVNAAAYTAVDKAESDAETAQILNAAAPGVLAEAANAVGAWLVHYSTDYVFDGSGSTPWLETDAAGPLNVYGQTKLEGEKLIASRCDKHLIFRTSWVYAARGGNFAKTMLRLAQERETLNVINDQFGAPTGADLIADVTAHAIVSVIRKPDDAGVYHLAASGETTWFDYAKYVVDQSIRAQTAPEIIVKKINPVTTSAFPTAAQRPHNSRLNTTKLQQTFALQLASWQQGVARMLAESQPNKI
ncbi:MAG: dTDP-4-dehydrorhamnose reductase [Polaromonas sp.]